MHWYNVISGENGCCFFAHRSNACHEQVAINLCHNDIARSNASALRIF